MLPPDPIDPTQWVQPASAIAASPIDWLWMWQLAFGKLAMLDGDSVQGKSLIALDLCTRLSTGRPMPDGSPGPGVFPSLIIQAEDGAADTVIPRLQALGADLDRVFVWRPLLAAGAPLCIPRNLDRLDAVLRHTGARFAVLDPIMAFLDSTVSSSSDPGVRRALAPLAQLLDTYRCAAMLVRHLNKQGGTHALYRGGGSIGLIASCRTAWLVGHDPLNRARRVLAQVKNNLAPIQASLAYEVRADNGDVPPTIAWLGPTTWTADQLLAAAAVGPPSPERERASRFLSAFLKDGPRPTREIWRAAKKERLSKRTLDRARKDLEIVSKRFWRNGVMHTYWHLPIHHMPVESQPAERNELLDFLAEQERKFPPPCPLDEAIDEE
jgi:hypothetical protein